MQMTHGALQDYALTLDKIIEHAAKWHGHKGIVTAIEGKSSRWTDYRHLLGRAKSISSRLAGSGVRPGDCVATLAWNTGDHMAAWYAIMGMGAVCHTLNPRLAVDTLGTMLRQSQARIIIASADQLELVRKLAEEGTELTSAFVIDAGDAPAVGASENLTIATFDDTGDDADFTWGEFDENQPCGLCFTSGTTAAPKGVTYTHRGNFLHTLRQLQTDVAGIGARDVVLPAVPMFHANAWGLPFSCPAVGAKLVLPGRDTDGESLARLIKEHSVTIAAGVPTVWLDLFDYLDREGDQVPSLSRVMVGGAPMPDALSRRILERGIEVQETWGMTELSPLGTAMPPGVGDGRSGKSGVPAIGVDLLLMDHEGQVLPSQRGNEGRLHVRGHSVVERYFGYGESATRDGWFDTGDLAVIDSDGILQITGRAKDLIKSGGEWVNPVEIESVVGSIPEVIKVAVIARSHSKWGERPVMVVETADGAEITDESLLEPVRQRFAKWWVPDEVIRVTAIPLAATGKIDKRSLQERYG